MQYLAKDKNWVFPIQLFKETGMCAMWLLDTDLGSAHQTAF
jgi:hypothetical protein